MFFQCRHREATMFVCLGRMVLELKAKNLKVVYEETQKEKKKWCVLVICLMFRKPQYRKFSLHCVMQIPWQSEAKKKK